MKILVSWIMKFLQCFSSHLIWAVDVEKQREKCVLHLLIMYLSPKGKREYSILTPKPWLPSKFFFSFFPLVVILSGSWAAGIALGTSSVPACTLLWQAKESVWAALGPSWKSCSVWRASCFPTHRAGPTAHSADAAVGLYFVGFGKHRVPKWWTQQCHKRAAVHNPPYSMAIFHKWSKTKARLPFQSLITEEESEVITINY